MYKNPLFPTEEFPFVEKDVQYALSFEQCLLGGGRATAEESTKSLKIVPARNMAELCKNSKKDIVAPDGIGDVKGRVVMGKATTDFFVNGKNVVLVVGIHEVWLIYGGNLVAVFLITDGAILVCYPKVLFEKRMGSMMIMRATSQLFLVVHG